MRGKPPPPPPIVEQLPLDPVQRFERRFDIPSAAELVEQLEHLVRRRLWLQIAIGMVAGIATGLLLSPEGGALGPTGFAESAAEWLAIPGQIFLALIQMMMIPLVVSSIVVGLASSGDLAYVRRVGARIGVYFVGTTIVAVVLGVALASGIEPGSFIDREDIETLPADSVLVDSVEIDDLSLPERIVGIVPTDPLQAALDRSMLQIVIGAILVGIAIVTLPDPHERTLLDLAGAVQELSVRVVSWAMLLAPYAVFGLLAQVMVDIGLDAIVGMAVYVGTVLLGLALLVGVYLAIVASLGRRNPRTFLGRIRAVQLLAFSTSSSAAVMPLSMQTAEDQLGVSKPVARFVIPLGATINMDGTAMYQVIGALFLTQAFGIHVAPWELVLLTATTVGASIGSPGTPGVGIVILATILQSIGVPTAGVALIIGVDRILDMTRTAVNVTGDLAACTVMERWVGGDEPLTIAADAPATEAGPAGAMEPT